LFSFQPDGLAVASRNLFSIFIVYTTIVLYIFNKYFASIFVSTQETSVRLWRTLV